jgi:hypothetical protein
MRPIQAGATSTTNPRYAFSSMRRWSPSGSRLGLRTTASCRWLKASGSRPLSALPAIDSVGPDLGALDARPGDELEHRLRLRYLRQAEDRSLRRYGRTLTVEELLMTVRRFEA